VNFAQVTAVELQAINSADHNPQERETMPQAIHKSAYAALCIHTHTQPFNGPLFLLVQALSSC